jgi:hypothetical protein
MVELAKIQKPENKDVILTVRTTQENKKWMDDNNISPSLFFDEAIKDLKEKLKKNVHRKECVICGKPTKEVRLGKGVETFSFCSPHCMKVYVKRDVQGEGLEVKGTRVYVK